MTIQELFHRGLSLDKLRSFLDVAQAGSVTKAAGGDESRRSLMSRQIGELEKTLGLELFLRSGRSIEITEVGRELAILIASFFAEFEGVVRSGLDMESRLRIGAGASVFEALVFPKLRLLEAAFPGCRFEFCGFPTNKAIDALHSGTIDLGIVSSGLDVPGIDEVTLGNIPFVLVARRDFDPNVANWSVQTALSRLPLTLISGQGRWVQAFQRLCRDSEIEPMITHRTKTFGQIRDLLRAGAPGGFLPVPLAAELPSSQFAIIQDEALGGLTRQLSVVFDSRAARVRDRLQSTAGSLAKVIGA